MSEDPSPGALVVANRLQEMALGERPQERAFAHGVGALSDAELLALILRSGTRGHDVMTLSQRLLSEAGSLYHLARWTEADFRRLKGIGKIKALQLCTVMEIARRVLSAERQLAPELNTPEEMYAFLSPRALGLDVEKCWVVSLNTRNRVLRCNELTSGTVNATLVRPAQILREVIREGATAFVVAHNHPSGDPFPSAQDARITRQIREAADAVQVVFIDHLVIGLPEVDPVGQGYYSFRQAGSL